MSLAARPNCFNQRND